MVGGKLMFPIMLNIHGRKCTVAGGGNVAERKDFLCHLKNILQVT